MSIILFFYGCMNVALKMILYEETFCSQYSLKYAQQQQYNKNISNKKICRHAQMDNIFDTIAIQLMALQSRDCDGLSLSSSYHTH